MKRLIFAAIAAACTLAATAAHAETVDFAPIVTPAVEAIGTVVAALAVPLVWYGVKLLSAKLHISGLEIDAAQRAVVDQAMQKAIGFAVSKVQDMVKGKPLTIDVKNAMVAEAANFAIAHAPEALDHFGIGPDEIATKLKAMVEARLGMAAVDAAPGGATPVAAAAAGTTG